MLSTKVVQEEQLDPHQDEFRGEMVPEVRVTNMPENKRRGLSLVPLLMSGQHDRRAVDCHKK